MKRDQPQKLRLNRETLRWALGGATVDRHGPSVPESPNCATPGTGCITGLD
jgi:hypothetical protein